MADEIDGGESPWAKDGPVPPPSPLPAAWTAAAAERPADVVDRTVASDPTVSFDPARPARPTELLRSADPIAPADLVEQAGSTNIRHRPRRSILVLGVAGVVLAAVIGVRTLSGSGGSSDDATADDIQDSSNPTESAPSTTERARRIPTAPSRPNTSSPDVTSEPLPEPAPEWVTTQVVLDPRLQAMTVPTELVVMNGAGVVHVIDVPSGVMRSIDTDIGRTSLAMVVGDRAIAVTSYDDGSLAIVDPDAAVSEVALLGGAGQMLARPGTNDFLVTPNNWSGNEPPPNMVVAADGSVTEVTGGPAAEYDIWSIRHIPATGEAVVEDSGGAYALDAAGAVRRITAGDLVAVGQNHLVVRECNEALVCIHFRIDAVTGDRQLVVVPDFEQQFRGYDPTISVSPDGSMMTYLDWESGPLERRLVHLDTGATEEIASNDQYGYGANAGWAADSSGIFVIDGRELMFHDTTTGEQVEVAADLDVGGIIAVASRPVVG